MDTIVQGPPEDGVQELNLVDTSEWSSVNTEIGNNTTGPYLYIAIKMEQPNGLAGQQEVYSDFDPHVSPLDPNMSSVARYSPVYNEAANDYNPIVFVTHESDARTDELCRNLSTSSTMENMPVLCNNDLREVNNQYLELVNNNGNIVNVNNVDNLQLVPENEQEVKLLITDQATGISYSVSTNELLVERCLDDPQLLEGLTPDPLLDSDLLGLGDNSTGLSDDIMTVDATVNNYINSLASNEIGKNVTDINFSKMETRCNGNVKNELDNEDDLLSCVYNISDKPILSRARASLPESFLIINKINDNDAVFAKKLISKRTQFGPLEGVLTEVKLETIIEELLIFFVKIDDIVARVDVSDENTSNWMGFVRKALNYEEQNLVISEDNGSLYFTTTRNIQPKQELKVGYSAMYAQTYNLKTLEPKQEVWPCYECVEKFPSSAELQKHLDIHDEQSKDENVKPLNVSKKVKKKLKIKKYETTAIECNLCSAIFAQYNYGVLKKHLNEVHKLNGSKSVEESFSMITNYGCDVCQTGFKSEALLKIHNLDHDPDSSEDQTDCICPACQRKFATQRKLINHVSSHSLPKSLGKVETSKCPICYKGFSTKERVQKHMMVHGSEENKPIKCTVCPKRFLNNSALACHIKTHYNGKQLFECPICKESFDHVLKLKLHIPIHCENNQYTCPYCTKTFRQYCVIRKHIRAFHCDKKFRCNQCPAAFPNHDKLKLHQLRHSDHREFLCAGCGKQFKRKDKLREHCKKMHSEERENSVPSPPSPSAKSTSSSTVSLKKAFLKAEPTDFHRFIYKCHTCLVGFKRRGMLVNHLAKKHPDIPPDSVPELNLPILQTTRIYYCQYCDKVYKSNSKRKAHILKNHPGAALPMSNRKKQSELQLSSLPNPTFSQTVGSITTSPQNCDWCHKQYASKAKLLQHRAKKHADKLAEISKKNNPDVPEEVNENLTIVTNSIGGYSIVDESPYCNLSINETCGNFMETGELESPSLYRLLTTSNGMLPPR